MKPRLEFDTFRFFFRPLDCSYTSSFFINKERFGDPLLFDELCVDFENGDSKPEIRVANTYTYFNITNYAYFENITFTGEDLFALLTTRKDETELENYDTTISYNPDGEYHPSYRNFKQSALAFYPKTKCTVREEPNDFFDKLDFHSTGYFPLNDYYINCTDGWEPENNRPPTEQDTSCIDITGGYLTGTTNCSGNPYNDDFFWFDGYTFPKRHQTLFNLYSFDSVRSTRTAPPELVITGCDFKYFAAGHDSLINIETNNFSFMNLHWENGEWTHSVDYGKTILLYMGEDNGAKIEITNSTFKHSSFCKGMIQYKRQTQIDFDELSRFLNLTV